MFFTTNSNSMPSSEDTDSQDSQMSNLEIIDSDSGIITTTFVTFDGLNSGVPTRTTPTLTPTTLRTIEQTLIDFQCETERESHQNEAGFVPPIVQPISQGSYMSLIDSKSWQGGTATVAPQSRPSVVTSTSTIPTATTTTTRKNTGGRRPARHISMSPEEEERRRVRRERNKMAAARCRKRRVDHTNALLIETEGLEQKKQGLQQEIQQLQLQKEELEFVLEAHKACCRLKDNSNPPSPPDIKPFALLPEVELKENAKSAPVFCEPPPAKRPLISGAKPPRPNTLPVATAFTPSRGNPIKPQVSLADVAGLSGNTPVGNFPLNFESLMEGGTGLTPVSGPMIPSCSSQQRNSGGMDLSSPDSVPPKLVSL